MSAKRKAARPRKKRRTVSARERLESQLARVRAFEALAAMRTKALSLAQAAREAQTTPRTVRKYIGRALTRRRGHYHAKPHDRLTRTMRFLTRRGVQELAIRSSRTASLIGKYWNAVDHYLKTGDMSLLRPFRGKSLRSGKVGYPFLTDPRTLNRLAHAGEVSFEDLYVLGSGRS